MRMRRRIEIGLLTLIIVLLVAKSDFMGSLDGYLFPVVSPASIAPVVESDGISTVSAEARKNRSCDWLRTEWFFGNINGRAAQVDMQHLDPPKIRNAGVLKWDRIEVGLTYREIGRNSYALVYHDCYDGWLWKTESVFFDSALLRDQE